MDHGLDLLDTAFPRTDRAFLCERVSQGLIMESNGTSPKGLHSWGGLQIYWKVRERTAERSLREWVRHLEKIDRMIADAGAVDTLRGEAYRAFREKWTDDPNPEIGKWWLGVELDRRTMLARLRVIRAAAQYRATGRIPAREDPFGTTLLHAETEKAITIWSVGPDGQDDEGNNPWDIALTLTRPPAPTPKPVQKVPNRDR